MNKDKLKIQEFKKISNKIEEIKYPLSSALSWILSYKKTTNSEIESYISVKFFNNQTKEVTEEDISKAKELINTQIKKFHELKKELFEENFLNEIQKNLLLNIINWNVRKLILFKYAIYIEAEKWWYKLDQKEKIQYLKNIERIETIIYWPKITNNPKEVEIIMTHLQNLFEKNQNKLNDDEKQIFGNFFNKFPDRSKLNKANLTNEDEENNWNLWKLKSIEACKIFKKVFEIYWIDTKIIIINDEINKFKKENNIFYIPWSFNEKQIEEIYKNEWIKDKMKIIVDPKATSVSMAFEKQRMTMPDDGWLSIKKICVLIDHEIGTHFLSSVNNKKILNIESDDYLSVQEGVAVLNQRLITESIKDTNINEPLISNISTFIGENYNFKDTKELLKIYNKLNWNDKDAEKKSTKHNNESKKISFFWSSMSK